MDKHILKMLFSEGHRVWGFFFVGFVLNTVSEEELCESQENIKGSEGSTE